MLDKILLSFVVFSGLIAGLLIARSTKEELKPGKLYFTLLKRILLLMLIILLFLNSKNYLYLFIGVLLGSFIKKTYLYLGLTFPLIFSYNHNILIYSLMFLFGLPYGTLIFKEKRWIKTMLVNALLFYVPLMLSLYKPFPALLSLSAGALVWELK